MRAEISYEAWFSAEHEPPGCPRHVNEFQLVVTVEGPIVGGFVMRFEELGGAVRNLLSTIECVPPIDALPDGSSVEQMAAWIWDQLKPGLPLLMSVRLYDGPCAVTYCGDQA